MKKALITGAAGLIGSHLERRLKDDGFYVVSVARKLPLFRPSVADEYNILDVTNPPEFHHHFFRHQFDEAYQLANDGGGIGYISDAVNDAAILSNSVKINLHTLEAIARTGNVGKVFFASSQCVYPEAPVDPFSSERIGKRAYEFAENEASFDNFAFAKEKLFAEALYDSFSREYGFEVAIARLGNTYGPYCTWSGNRAKAPAAICRKVAEAAYAAPVKLWGSGRQHRSFTYVDDAVEGIRRLMASDYNKPLNIASGQMVSIAELFDAVCGAAGKVIAWQPSEGPIGVLDRGSDNTKCVEVLGWEPTTPLTDGICTLYKWVSEQVNKQKVA